MDKSTVCRRASTPPSSPCLGPTKESISLDDLQKVLVNVIKTLGKSPDSMDVFSALEKAAPAKSDRPRVRASKLEFKTVNEAWDPKLYKYMTVLSPPSAEEINELDEYVFVVHRNKVCEPITYVDIKSMELRDILRKTFSSVKLVCLREDMPTVEQNILFQFLLDLENHENALTDESNSQGRGLEHLSLLTTFIKKTYATTASRLSALLKNGEITYDLLWALFKPNASVFTICPNSEQPRCVEYVSGEEKTTAQGQKYFHLECRYFDFNGKVFGEASTQLGIAKFRGVKRINTLEAFPLEYHACETDIIAQLVACGRKFISLIGTHHREYHGVAFYISKGAAIKIPVSDRVMIDPGIFRELNPSYRRPRVYEQDQSSSIDVYGDYAKKPTDQVKDNGMDPSEMKNQDLLKCSPTIPGWILGDKIWAEFAVQMIQDINWNPNAFESLKIPAEKKKVILALAEAYITPSLNDSYDDFVAGKGKGMIVLLHGPPGVGKTLTAETLSEHLRKPLYSISAGELGEDAALVLLDEADVFVQERSLNHTANGLISVFLRKVEYYQGVMFLTTNRVKSFDPAFKSRITVALKYDPLSVKTRRTIWRELLKKATTQAGPATYKARELDDLAAKNLNGREIKNNVTAAWAMAKGAGETVSFSHLSIAVRANEEFDVDFLGNGLIENLNSYS